MWIILPLRRRNEKIPVFACIRVSMHMRVYARVRAHTCICMYVCVYMRLHARVRAHMCICMYVRICACMHVYARVRVYMCICMYACICACMHVYARVRAHMCICMYVCICACMRVYTCVSTPLLLITRLSPLPLLDNEPWRQCRAARRDALIPASTPVLRWEESLGFLHLTGPQVTSVSRGPGCCRALACGGPAGQFRLSSLSPLQPRIVHSGVSKSVCHQASKSCCCRLFTPLPWVVCTSGESSAGAALSSCLTGRRQSGP